MGHGDHELCLQKLTETMGGLDYVNKLVQVSMWMIPMSIGSSLSY